jgi:hypothetical protein
MVKHVQPPLEITMKKIFAFLHKLIVSDVERPAKKGFSAFATWFNVAGFATFSAWAAWLGEPTLKAWREADRVVATHGFDHTTVVVLAFLLFVAASLLIAVILAGAAYKAIIDRMQ